MDGIAAIESRIAGIEARFAPALVVWGTADIFFGIEWAHWLHETLPRCAPGGGGRAGGSAAPAVGSVAKLARTRSMTFARDLATDLLGPYGTLTDSTLPRHRSIISFVLTVPSKSIAGGTDEVQRNLVGERALGLPKEPGDHARIPFKNVPRGA